MANETLPLEIDDAMKDAIGTAFESRNPLTVAYNGEEGWPHLSRRGSTQVFGPQQLALWIRKRDEGLAAALGSRPEVTLYFLDLAERGVVYTFYGRGRVSTAPADGDRVWAATPERERAQDPDRNGVAVIVDLVRIVAQGIKPELNFVMEA
jgi:hypothetical protein